MHFCRIYVFLLTVFNVFIVHSRIIEIVRRGPSDERGCDSRLLDSRTAFTASSYLHDSEKFRPHHARLSSLYAGQEHTSGRAWCPNNTVQTALNEWISVDFKSIFIIRSIFTAGLGDGNVDEYMPSFILHYQREDGGPWYEHKNKNAERVIHANFDPRNTARHTFDPTIIARRIRIYPYSAKSPRRICLRFALLGCPFLDGVTEYVAPDGSRGILGTGQYQPIDFRDLSNDAQHTLAPTRAQGGLGKLVDNGAYLGNVSQDHPNENHFVGWQNAQHNPVPIEFKFNTTRNFTRANIFTVDSPKLHAALFNRIVVEFRRLDGSTSVEENRLMFQLSNRETFNLDEQNDNWRGVDQLSRVRVFRNREWDGAVVVSIPLKGKIADEVVLQFTPSDEWIFISEIEFISEPHNPPRLDEPVQILPEPEWNEIHPVPSPEPPDVEALQTTFDGSFDSISVPSRGPDQDSTRASAISDNDSSSTSSSASATATHRADLAKDQLRSNTSQHGTTFIVVIVVSLVLSLFCVILVFCMCVRQQHSRQQQHRSLKKISGANPDQPSILGSGGGGGSLGYQRTGLGSSVNSSGVPCCTAPTAAYLFNHPQSTGTGALYSQTMQLLSTPTVFAQDGATASAVNGGPAGTAFHGLPSPGHNFGDFNNLAAMQHLALQHQQNQFYPIGMIHPATAGDVTTDSGSLYTTPPDLFPVTTTTTTTTTTAAQLPSPVDRNGVDCSPPSSSSTPSTCSSASSGNGGQPPMAPVERSSVSTSASEAANHQKRISGGDIETADASMALLRPVETNGGGGGGRKRQKHRRSTVAAAGGGKRSVTESMQQSRADSGLGSTRTDPKTTAPLTPIGGLFTVNGGPPGRLLHQPFAAQPFPNPPASSDNFGTEYASTSLFSSSTASTHNFPNGTLKQGSSPLIGGVGVAVPTQYPLLATTTPQFTDPSGQSATAVVAGGGSYHLYHQTPLIMPAATQPTQQQQAQLFQTGFVEPQLLPAATHFLSQGILHAADPSVTVYPSEATGIVPNSNAASGTWINQASGLPTWSAGTLKSSSGTPLPPVPLLPLPPNPHLHPHHHHSGSGVGGGMPTDGTSSGRLSIYSVCL